jgi:hypothetical protein
MIDETKVKQIKKFGDFYDCVEGDILRVPNSDRSLNLELLVGSNKKINFYRTCKAILDDKHTLNGNNGNCVKKVIEICYLSQDDLSMGGHKLTLRINDPHDKRRELYHKYFNILSEKELI